MDGTDHPVAYTSGLFRGSQLNWAALTKEAYAIYVKQQRQEERLLLFDQLRTRLCQRCTAALDLINDPFLLTEKADGGTQALNSFERD